MAQPANDMVEPFPDCASECVKQTTIGEAGTWAIRHTCRRAELVAAIGQQTLRSEEVLDHYLDRLERFNGQINAVVATDVDAARAAPARRTLRRPGGELGAAARAADDGEGHVRGCRHGLHRGRAELKDHQPNRHHGGRAPDRGRGDHLWQDQHAALRRGPADLQRGLRHDQQSLGREPRAGGRRAVPPPRWRPASPRWNWDRTLAARSAIRRISVASPGTSRALARCRSVAIFRGRRVR